MARQVAQEHQDYLSTIHKYIKQSYGYFRDNYRRYDDWLRYIYVTTITPAERTALAATQKPQIEFNKMEAYLNRQVGEFAKAQPELTVGVREGQEIPYQILQLVQGHLEEKFHEAKVNGIQVEAFKQAAAGGMSVFKLWSSYMSDTSFAQDIHLGLPMSPTLCLFDVDAKLVHKGDGKYCAEMIPMRREVAEDRWPQLKESGMSFARSGSDDAFNWSFHQADIDILMVCDFYVKKQTRFRLVQLANGQTMPKDEYEKFVEEWEMSGRMEQAPAIVRERTTYRKRICRYRCVEDRVLEYEETPFHELPLVYVDWNGIKLKNPTSNSYEEIARGYLYNAKGAQQLTNLSGQSLANEIENTIQAKYIIAEESLPTEEDWIRGITDIQSGIPLVYNYLDRDNPAQTLPPPQAIPRTPIPQEISGTFAGSDSIFRAVLGSYDSAEGAANQLSGVAMRAGAIQANSTASVGIQNYLTSLSQVGKVMIDMMREVYKDRMSLPIRMPSGVTQDVQLRQLGPDPFNFGPDSLSFTVKAGANFAIQKADSLAQVTQLMQSSPAFAEFINTKGLRILIQNMDIVQQTELQQLAQDFIQQQEQQQAQAMQNPQPNPEQLRAQTEIQKAQLQAQIQREKLQADVMSDREKMMATAAKDQADREIKLADLAIAKQKADTDAMKAAADIHGDSIDAAVQMEKASAEKARTAADLAMTFGHKLDE